MMVNSALEVFISKLNKPLPSEMPDNLPGKFSLSGQIFLHWAAATQKGLVEFQNDFPRPLSIIIFKPKMVISRVKILVHLF